MAEAYKSELIKNANSAADQLQSDSSKSHTINQIRQQTNQCREMLTTQRTTTLNGLDAAEEQSINELSETMEQLLRSIGQTLQATMQTLGKQEIAQLHMLRDAGARHKMEIEKTAQSATVSLQQSVAQAAMGLITSMNYFSASLHARAAPHPEILRGVLAAVTGQIDERVVTSQAQIEEGIGFVEQGINQRAQQTATLLTTSGQQAIVDVTSVGRGLTTTLAELSIESADTFAQLEASHKTTVGKIGTTSAAGFQQIAAQISTGFNQTKQDLERSFSKALISLARSCEAYSLIEDRIRKEAENAASQVEPRWKTVLKVLLPIAIILITIVVAPFVIGAVGAVAGVLGATGVLASTIGAVVGGAILGIAASVIIQMGTNLIDGKFFLEDVWKAAVIGAIGGALGGAGGALGNWLANAGRLGVGLVQTSGKFVLDIAADIVGGVLGELAVGNPITLAGILIGAGIGAGVSLGASGLGRLVRPKADTPTTLRPDEQTRGGPLTEGATLVGARSKANPELTMKVGDTGHVIEPRLFQGRARLFMCSAQCGPIIIKIDQALKNINRKHHDWNTQKNLIDLHKDIVDFEQEIGSNRHVKMTDSDSINKIKEIEKKLDKLLKSENEKFLTLLDIKKKDPGEFIRKILGSSFGVGVWKFPKQKKGDGIIGENCISAAYKIPKNPEVALHVNFKIDARGYTAPRENDLYKFPHQELYLKELHITARSARDQKTINENNTGSIITADKSIHFGPNNDWDWNSENVKILSASLA